MVASTVAYNDLQDRQIGLGIATVVLGVLAGIVLQYTRRVRNMPSYFVANYSFFRGTLGNHIHRQTPSIATRSSHPLLFNIGSALHPADRLGDHPGSQCGCQSCTACAICRAVCHFHLHTLAE